MQRKYPWNKVADVDWPAWTSTSVEHEFRAFLVDVKDCVEVTMAEEDFAVKLQMQLVSVCFYAFEKFWRERLCTEFLD
jgi:hypothetical protein